MSDPTEPQGNGYVNQDGPEYAGTRTGRISSDKGNSVTISSHLPDLVDNYISLRAQRLALDKEAASLKETGHFEFLHKRIATLAIKEHWEAGENIPGVGTTTVFKLSVSKS